MPVGGAAHATPPTFSALAAPLAETPEQPGTADGDDGSLAAPHRVEPAVARLPGAARHDPGVAHAGLDQRQHQSSSKICRPAASSCTGRVFASHATTMMPIANQMIAMIGASLNGQTGNGFRL